MKKSILLKLSAMALSLGLITGCATSEQLKQMEADIAKAQETADAAMGKANAAMDAANAAQASADECNERCSRMAEKAMAK
jgi:outer membrane murein-binding lipoprotein Lpp